MINFRPFNGVRPAKQKAAVVTSKNIDSYKEDEIKKEIATNPESFLQIVKPVLDSSSENKEKAHKEIRNNFEQFISDDILLKDNKSFYIYEQEQKDGTTIVGVIGVVNVDDFKNGDIKKHESTIERREKAFAKYLASTHFQVDPVLLTFPENQSIELIMSMATRKTPTLEFKGEDNLNHKLWQVKDRLVMKQLKSAIEKLPSLYIADGHHRMGSSALYCDLMREDDPDYFGGESFNFVMTILIPGNHLRIYDYNRLIKDINGLSKEEFLQKIGETFTIVEKGDTPYYPSHKHHISMYLDGHFYGLYVDHILRGEPKGLGELDTYLWEENLMKPILGIENSRTDERIKFEKGTGDINGTLKLKEAVDSGEFKVAFGFYPIAVNDLILVADQGLTMPPKSTYIEPKFLTALTIFDLID